MYNFLWFHLDWHPMWLIFWVVVSLVVMRLALATGVLLLALIIYNGFVWNSWVIWMPHLFWLALSVSLIGIIWGLVNGGGRVFALWAALAALVISVLLANSDAFGASPPLDRKVPGITGRLNRMDARIDQEHDARIEEYGKLRDQIRNHSHGSGDLQQQIADLEARIYNLENGSGGK